MEFETRRHKAKYDVALDAIKRLFIDESVSKEQTVMSMIDLRHVINQFIESLESGERRQDAINKG